MFWPAAQVAVNRYPPFGPSVPVDVAASVPNGPRVIVTASVLATFLTSATSLAAWNRVPAAVDDALLATHIVGEALMLTTAGAPAYGASRPTLVVIEDATPPAAGVPVRVMVTFPGTSGPVPMGTVYVHSPCSES